MHAAAQQNRYKRGFHAAVFPVFKQLVLHALLSIGKQGFGGTDELSIHAVDTTFSRRLCGHKLLAFCVEFQSLLWLTVIVGAGISRANHSVILTTWSPYHTYRHISQVIWLEPLFPPQYLRWEKEELAWKHVAL